VTNISQNRGKRRGQDIAWSAKRLWEELGEDKARVVRLKVDRAVVAVLLAAEPVFEVQPKIAEPTRYFQLLGFDIILSDDAQVSQVFWGDFLSLVVEFHLREIRPLTDTCPNKPIVVF
jgi:hypothetical protein